MSAKDDRDEIKSPPSTGRPKGAIALFGKNPSVLDEMRTRLRIKDISESELKVSDQITTPPRISSIESPDYMPTNASIRRSESCSTPNSTPQAGPSTPWTTSIRNRVRKPPTRLPTYVTNLKEDSIGGSEEPDKLVEFFITPKCSNKTTENNKR